MVRTNGGDVAVGILLGLVEHVTAHPAGDVDNDVGVGVADALDDLAVVVELAARRAGVRLADVEVGDGGTGLAGLDAGVGDLLGGLGEGRVDARGVTGARAAAGVPRSVRGAAPAAGAAGAGEAAGQCGVHSACDDDVAVDGVLGERPGRGGMDGAGADVQAAGGDASEHGVTRRGRSGATRPEDGL